MASGSSVVLCTMRAACDVTGLCYFDSKDVVSGCTDYYGVETAMIETAAPERS